MLAHNVFFALKDNSAESKKKLVDACKKYLSKHPGEVFFAAGTLNEELNRPVNDRDFDVGLHIVFKDKASHDKYQDAERHLKFIEENKELWAKVRVFDSEFADYKAGKATAKAGAADAKVEEVLRRAEEASRRADEALRRADELQKRIDKLLKEQDKK